MTRARLPNRRPHEIYDIEFQGQRFTVGVGRFDDFSPSEVFIDAEKTSQFTAIARDAAVCLSISLQHGVPADAMRAAISRDSQGEPSGIVGAVFDLLADRVP